SADSRSEIERGVIEGGDRGKDIAVRRDQLLVGGDEFAAAAQRADRDRSGRLIAADRFDHDIGVLGKEGFQIAREQRAVYRQVSLARAIANENAGEDEADAESRGDGSG